MEETANDLDRFLASMGLSGGGQKPPLKPVEDSAAVKMVNVMRERLKSQPGGQVMVNQFEQAFKLIELSSLFDLDNSKAPHEFRKSMHDMLDYYIIMAADTIKEDGSGQKQAFISGLRNLVGMAQRMAYAHRAMEEDGRWGDLTGQP